MRTVAKTLLFDQDDRSGAGDEDLRGPIDWQKAYDELAAYGDTSLPIHALKEGEFVVIKTEER